MLALEVELLTGCYRAASIDGLASEWPPHPERVFSALVQAWGDGQEDDSERAALEWLERRTPPYIEADALEETSRRDAPTVFVPPNDPSGAKIEVLPERRKRQARSFHVLTPNYPMVRFLWDDDVPSEVLRGLTALANRVASIGHSSSLTRCAFTTPEDQLQTATGTWAPSPDGTAALRVYYPGRLAELSDWFRGQTGPIQRPRSRATARYSAPRSASNPTAQPSFLGKERDWFVFESVDGTAPDVLATPHIARRVRDALMQHCGEVPELLSGHQPDGAPSQNPHVAVLPLCNVGWAHSTGDVLGFAVVIPDGADPNQRLQVLRAIASFSNGGSDSDSDLRRAQLQMSNSMVWHLERAAYPSRVSLRPDRWCGTTTTWASVTPVLLDRFPKQDALAEQAEIIAGACRNIGLPEPSEIEFHKHSAINGAVSAYPARGRRERPDWSFPRGSKFAQRPRRHVVLRFAEPVRGPVVLGAGRYHGMGLCLPISE